MDSTCNKFNSWQILSIMLALSLVASWLICGWRLQLRCIKDDELDDYQDPSEPNYWRPNGRSSADLASSNLGLTIRGKRNKTRGFGHTVRLVAQWPFYSNAAELEEQQQIDDDGNVAQRPPRPTYFEVEIAKWQWDVRLVGEGIPNKVFGIGLRFTSGNYSELLYGNEGALWILPYQDDSYIFDTDNSKFGEGDIVGCGLLPSLDEVFFTKNGEFIGKHKLYSSNNNKRSTKIYPSLAFLYDDIELRSADQLWPQPIGNAIQIQIQRDTTAAVNSHLELKLKSLSLLNIKL